MRRDTLRSSRAADAFRPRFGATRGLPVQLAAATILLLASVAACGGPSAGRFASSGLAAPDAPAGRASGRRLRAGFEFAVGPGGEEGAPEREVRGSFREIAGTAAWELSRSLDLIGKWGFGRIEGRGLLGEAQPDSADFSPGSFALGLRCMTQPGRFFRNSLRAHVTGLAVRRGRDLRYQWQNYSDTDWGAEFAVGLGNWIRAGEGGRARIYVEWGYRFVHFDAFAADVNGKTVQLILPANGKPITLDESAWLIRLGALF